MFGFRHTSITGEFLRDTGARNNQDLLVYTTGTEVGGIAGNFAGLGNGQMLDDTNARMNPNGNTRVRGLAEADNTRDFFLTDIPWDSFNVGRVDLQRGANAMLFGVGSPAGIVNSSTNAAAFSKMKHGRVPLRQLRFRPRVPRLQSGSPRR
jgi:outer membrane receptor protein involved in Fe transport